MDSPDARLSREDCIEVLRLLNYCVVSCDRLGSRMARLPDDDQKQLAFRFMTESKLFKSLARARSLLCDRYEEAFRTPEGHDDSDDLYEPINDIQFWTGSD